MTTAHRPTWKAAVGRSEDGGWSAGGLSSAGRSVYAAPAHTTLKYRNNVDQKEALRQSLLALEEVEASAMQKIRRRSLDPAVEERAQQRLLKQTAEVDEVALKAKYDDSDVEDGGGGEEEESDLDAEDSDLDDSDSSDDDEDDEAALQAELAKIRAEREEAKRKEQEQLEAEENERQEEAALVGNPLLNDSFGQQIKRKWNDDVVFRNQAKDEPKPKKRFINDTIRNDFHKRFLDKFIR
ncbi:protein CWC15 [Fistulifera solaris]|uniref:Protein CWC15 n=1 Tax=Fistulifera solaris TaxID=1519565 RepID=A0A1Z5K5J0_FISSO|nr:protein CWC15 [Fistulifera solaris]|eukprot:GAX21489.1 protein CWC15 [Fistulifera solaris]